MTEWSHLFPKNAEVLFHIIRKKKQSGYYVVVTGVYFPYTEARGYSQKHLLCISGFSLYL